MKVFKINVMFCYLQKNITSGNLSEKRIDTKILKPKLIMVFNIEGVTVFTENISAECDSDFIDKIAGR